MAAVTTSEVLLEQAVELLTEIRDLLRQGSVSVRKAPQSVTASPATEGTAVKAAAERTSSKGAARSTRPGPRNR